QLQRRAALHHARKHVRESIAGQPISLLVSAGTGLGLFQWIQPGQCHQSRFGLVGIRMASVLWTATRRIHLRVELRADTLRLLSGERTLAHGGSERLGAVWSAVRLCWTDQRRSD